MTESYILQKEFYKKFSLLNKDFPLRKLDGRESGCLVYGNDEIQFVVKNYQQWQKRFEIRVDFVSWSKLKNKRRCKMLKKAFPSFVRVRKDFFSFSYHLVVFRGELGISPNIAVRKLREKYNLIQPLLFKEEKKRAAKGGKSLFPRLNVKRRIIKFLTSFVWQGSKRKQLRDKLLWRFNSENSLMTIAMRSLFGNVVWNSFLTRNKFCYKIYKFFNRRNWAEDTVFEKHLMIMQNVWDVKAQQADILAEQNAYDLSDIENAEEIIIFFIPPWNPLWGGIMTMFSICSLSREIKKDAVVLMCTLPGFNFTFSVPGHFPTNEKVYRFEQICKHAQKCKKMLLHLVTYSPEFFYRYLSRKERKFLKSIDQLQINLMNQSIVVCPPFEKIKDLKKLTSDITMTTAHQSYATQEGCNRYQMPLKHISTWLGLDRYAKTAFSDKSKLILYSPDPVPEKEYVLQRLRQQCPEYEFRQILHLTFSECMELTSKSLLSISFGEGFDGYLLSPLSVGSLGTAVYNTRYFPTEEWKECPLVYSSYQELADKLPKEIKSWENNPSVYYATLKTMQDMKGKIYSEDKIKKFLREFYDRQYDFYPEHSYWRDK